MRVRVRTIDGRDHCHIPGISRQTSVASFKSLVEESWEWAWAEDQRLFFAGKELRDDAELFEYGVKVNDVIQLLVKGGGGGERMMRGKVKVRKVFSFDQTCGPAALYTDRYVY